MMHTGCILGDKNINIHSYNHSNRFFVIRILPTRAVLPCASVWLSVAGANTVISKGGGGGGGEKRVGEGRGGRWRS